MSDKAYKVELQKSIDACYGTLAWIEPRVSADVLAKIQTVMRMSFNIGVLTTVIEGKEFRDGIDEEMYR